jgi:hypothetical protein
MLLMPPQVIALLAVIAIGALGLIVYNVRSDRWRNADVSDSSKTDWIGLTGPSTSCVMISATIGSDRANSTDIAIEALKRIHCHSVLAFDDVVEGWTNGEFPKLRTIPQQVAIRVYANQGGHMQFMCCSRPRWANTVSDFGTHERVANKLANEVLLLTKDRET